MSIGLAVLVLIFKYFKLVNPAQVAVELPSIQKTKLLLLILFIFFNLIPTFLFAQVDTSWVRRYDGTAHGEDYARAIAIDDFGNIYVAGVSENSGTSNDIVTIKYNSQGEQQWVAIYNGALNENDDARAITVDRFGNVYITGYSTEYIPGMCDCVTIKYNNAGGQEWVAIYSDPSGDNDGGSAIIVDSLGNVYVAGSSQVGGSDTPNYLTIKYNNNGTQQWVNLYDGPAHLEDWAEAIAVDRLGNVYVTGFSTGIGTGWDYATIKYNALGTEQWVMRYNGSDNSSDGAHAIALDSLHNVYVTGGSAGLGTYTDIATIKYSTSGVQQWVVKYHKGDEWANAIIVNGVGDVYVTGGSLDTSLDYVTIKYSTDGIEQWVARYDGPAHFWDEAFAIALDTSDNIYVTGRSYGVQHDFATVKYNANGVEQWVIRYNGPTNSEDWATDIVIDSIGNCYVTGYSNGPNSYDFTTIKYIQTVGIQENRIVTQNNLENFPNPFLSITTIGYLVNKKGEIIIKIYNADGQLVRTIYEGEKQAGSYTINWDGRDNEGVKLPSGSYFYQLEIDGKRQTKKMVLVR
ncbi:MAG: SBBP repeat-containing protein [candidate division WOR-3 bacterium]